MNVESNPDRKLGIISHRAGEIGRYKKMTITLPRVVYLAICRGPMRSITLPAGSATKSPARLCAAGIKTTVPGEVPNLSAYKEGRIWIIPVVRWCANEAAVAAHNAEEAKLGLQVKDIYYTPGGQHNTAMIVEANAREPIGKFMSSVEALGNVKLKFIRAFSIQEMRNMV